MIAQSVRLSSGTGVTFSKAPPPLVIRPILFLWDVHMEFTGIFTGFQENPPKIL